MNANGATALICAISFIHQELVDIIGLADLLKLILVQEVCIFE
jgi:hypothetical protein